jgi:hypothetical protein
MHSYPAFRLARLTLAGAALLAAVCARSADLSFVGNLSTAQKSSAGLSKLSSSQESILDALVTQDVTLAHDGGVTGFSSAFSERHMEREGLASGLTALNPQERAALDTYAATAIAIGPPPEQTFSYSPPRATPSVAIPPKAAVATPLKAEIHGDISFTVGGSSHGGSFYGTSMDVAVTDPTGHFTVAVGFDDYRGKGLLGLCAADGLLYPYPY